MSQTVLYPGNQFVALPGVLGHPGNLFGYPVMRLPAGKGTAFVDPQPPGPPTLFSAPDKLVASAKITVTINPGGIAAALPFLKPRVRLGGFTALYLEKRLPGGPPEDGWQRVGQVWAHPEHGQLHQVYACPGFASLTSGVAHTTETRFADTEADAAADEGFTCWGPLKTPGYRNEGWVPEKGFQYRTYVEVIGPGDIDSTAGWSDPTKVF